MKLEKELLAFLDEAVMHTFNLEGSDERTEKHQKALDDVKQGYQGKRHLTIENVAVVLKMHQKLEMAQNELAKDREQLEEVKAKIKDYLIILGKPVMYEVSDGKGKGVNVLFSLVDDEVVIKEQ